MADIETKLDVELMHKEIVAQIAEAFPSFKTVEFYRDDETDRMPTPAVLLDMDDAEPSDESDNGTGQLPAFLRFEARIIMGKRSPIVRLEVRKAALALAAWLKGRHWGNGVLADECQVLVICRDEFDPAMDQFAVWRVEWRNRVYLGDSAWTNEGAVPESWFSFAPDIGADHKDDYQPVGFSA